MSYLKFLHAGLFTVALLLSSSLLVPVKAERVASIIDTEVVDQITLAPDHSAKVFERKRAVPFIPASPCITKERGIYKHEGTVLKTGDVITHEGLEMRAGHIAVKRYNTLAGSKDGQDLAGTIQTCQISESGYKRAEEQCELIWLNFDGCAP